MRVIISSVIFAGLTYLSFLWYPVQPTLVGEDAILVELFTSQGCSSCPPADRVLQKLNEEAQKGELSLVALSFHVDYWNRLGWKDPYSDAAYSSRQRTYASKLNDQRIYTPELVVNGRSGHVGSRELEVRNAIKKATKSHQSLPFQIAIKEQDKQTLQLAYDLNKLPEDHLLQVALVSPEVSNEVPRGENHGRHLKHVQVVRSLQSISLDQLEGSLSVDLSVLEENQQGQVVAFLQHKDTWGISGVRAISFRH